MFSQIKRAKISATDTMETLQGVSDRQNGFVTDALSSVCITLHPLVIMNVSDHFTRIKAQEGGNPQSE